MRRYPLLAFFLIAFLISWAVLLPEAAAEQGWLGTHVPQPLFILAGYGPALAAVLVSVVSQGRQGLRSLLGRVLIWRVGVLWYLVALFLPAVFLLAALGIHLALGGAVDWGVRPILEMAPEGVNPWLLLLPALLAQALIVFGEELGWRGFALPRLQSKDNALIASLIIGVIWGVWHLPMAFAPAAGAAVSQVPLLWFGVDILASAFIFTWIFNNARGSLLLALLFHASNNTAAVFLPIFSTIQDDFRLFTIIAGLRWAAALIIVIFGGSYFARSYSQEEITS